MRDERLNRMWNGKKVRFLRPSEDINDEENDEDDAGGFFNIFALHQNRDLGRGSKNCIQESSKLFQPNQHYSMRSIIQTNLFLHLTFTQ